jgi:hypothetical protein
VKICLIYVTYFFATPSSRFRVDGVEVEREVDDWSTRRIR